MKKTMALAIGISFGPARFFAGCSADTNSDGGISSENAHTHTLSYTAAAEATCTETGNTAYWYCAECGTYFSDEAATEEIALSDTVIAALGHSYTETATKEATCTEEGILTYTCTVCGDTYTETIAALGHNYVNGACTRCSAEVASEGLEYELSSDGTYTVIGIGTYTDTELIIPSVYNNLLITAISARAFYKETQITSVTIPDSVTVIGDRAFQLCSAMKAASVGSGLTEMGNYLFYGCTSLTNVAVGSSVTVIGSYAFYNCAALTKITLPDSVTVLSSYAFYHCTALASVTLGNGLTEIGNYAFWECSALASITIPANVTRIGCFAFYQCASLTSVTFADTGGWYVLRTESASVGTDVTLTDSASAAAYLTSTYCRYYWYRSAT